MPVQPRCQPLRIPLAGVEFVKRHRVPPRNASFRHSGKPQRGQLRATRFFRTVSPDTSARVGFGVVVTRIGFREERELIPTPFDAAFHPGGGAKATVTEFQVSATEICRTGHRVHTGTTTRCIPWTDSCTSDHRRDHHMAFECNTKCLNRPVLHMDAVSISSFLGKACTAARRRHDRA